MTEHEHRWVDTGGQLLCWPPIKIFKCVVCNVVGNVRGKRYQPDTNALLFDMSEMTCKNKVCFPPHKSTTESI